MAQLKSQTLNDDAQTFTLDVDAASVGTVVMDFTGTITVTWTILAPGGSISIPLRKADDSTAAAYTADDYFQVLGPCRVVGTSSATSGGTCAIEARTGNIN